MIEAVGERGISRSCEKKKMLGLWSIESTPENAAIKSLCARRVHGRGRRYKQVQTKEQRVGTSYQSSALEDDSWCAGSGEEDCRTILVPDSNLSYRRSVNLGLGPLDLHIS
jgi:hypothetical protein